MFFSIVHKMTATLADLQLSGYNETEYGTGNTGDIQMAFDGITVANLQYELQQALEGGRISKIAQPEADELLLTVKSAKGNYRLFISASASLPLLYLTQTNKPSPLTAPGFCMLLSYVFTSSIWTKWVISVTKN